MIERIHIVGKKGKFITFTFAAFRCKDAAEKFAENANAWYGEDHPLTPLTVWNDDVLFEPPLFPSPTASAKEMFESLR